MGEIYEKDIYKVYKKINLYVNEKFKIERNNINEYRFNKKT